MTRVLNTKVKILLVVTIVVLITTVVLYSCHLLKEGTTPESQPSSTTTENVMTTPLTTESTTTSTTTEETTTEPTEEATTTTTTTAPKTSLTTAPPRSHHFSHLVIFLDVQRAVFFHTPENGEAIPEVSLRISTGLVAGSTPVTPPDKPFVLSGYRANQLLFTKASKWVWVRYATHVAGDIFIHSQPYDHQVDANGNTMPLDKSLFSKWGYNRLGKNTASNGCIRLSLRDAQYLSQNIHRGMPCYIFASSKGYKLPEAEALPPANLNSRWDPTDTDPMSPYVQRAENNLAWKYKPAGQTIDVMLDEKPVAIHGIKNLTSMPGDTSYKFKIEPITSVIGLFDAKVIVTYSDKSAEEVNVKINVIDPNAPTTTTTTTTTTPTTTEPPMSSPEAPTTTTTPAPTDPPVTSTTEKVEIEPGSEGEATP